MIWKSVYLGFWNIFVTLEDGYIYWYVFLIFTKILGGRCGQPSLKDDKLRLVTLWNLPKLMKLETCGARTWTQISWISQTVLLAIILPHQLHTVVTFRWQTCSRNVFMICINTKAVLKQTVKWTGSSQKWRCEAF